jgi:hypothetical protein
MARKSKSLRLKDRHGWKSKPGNAICAINRGAIRFDYPRSWHVSADEGQVNLRDAPEPDDNCVLGVSQMQLPAQVADQVPIRELVMGTIQEKDFDRIDGSNVVEVPREDGMELAYMEIIHLDQESQRQACTRIAVARGAGVYCLITFDFWQEDATKFEAVWKEVLRSLTLGVFVKDPTVGPVTN